MASSLHTSAARRSAGGRLVRRSTVAAAAAEKVAKPVAKTDKPLNIVFVSTEVAPWSKTGGLGDVVRSRSLRGTNRPRRDCCGQRFGQ